MSTFRAYSTIGALSAVATIAAIAGMQSYDAVERAETPVIDPNVECVQNESISAIFAEGTDPAVIAKVYEQILEPYRLAQEANSRYFVGSRWQGSIGSPTTVTYSFPPDGLNVGGANVLHADLTGHFGSEAAWKDLFRQSFDAWEAYTGNTYVEVSDDGAFWGASGPEHGGSGRGDIRIASRNIDGGSNTLAFNTFPGAGNGGDMVIDSSENWSQGAALNFRFFRNVIMHENGHGMGIFHVCTLSSFRSLMNPFASTAFDGPRHDDIRAMTRLYGDPFEPNNNITNAEPLGTLDPMDSVSIINATIHAGSEDDFFEIDMTSSGFISATATPVGFSYNMGAQAGNGSCPTGPVFNSLNQHNLRIRILNAAGGELFLGDDTLAGSPETVTDVPVAAAGTYYVAVDSTDGFIQESQIYNLEITTSIPLPTGDINADCVVDTADLGGLIGTFGGPGPFGDINGDGVVDTADLGALIGNFGQTCADL